MVLVMGQNQAGNILHVVTGPESDAAMAVNGNIILDITPALRSMDTERPVILQLTKCQSEQKLVGDMQAGIQAGSAYPFFPPMIVFGPKAAVEAITPSTAHPANTDAKTKHVADPIMGECSLCKSKNVELVPKIDPKMCYDCVRIDLGLKRSGRAKKTGEGHA